MPEARRVVAGGRRGNEVTDSPSNILWIKNSPLLTKISISPIPIWSLYRIDGISAFNDESDRDGVRVVIELRKGAILKVVLNQLFSNTQLQTTFGIINPRN